MKLRKLVNNPMLKDNGKEINFNEKTFSVDKYKFEMIFSGSLGLQLGGIYKSGIGGDPYIQPLIGDRFKIPYGEKNYKYIDNNDDNERFLINFSTKVLKGECLQQLNNFVLETIMKRNKQKSIKDTAKMLFSKGLTLDTDACFMEKIYIRKDDDEFYFDLDKFRVVDKNGKNCGLPRMDLNLLKLTT